MRVLNTTTFELEEIPTAPTKAERLQALQAKAEPGKAPEYAILSHRWITSKPKSDSDLDSGAKEEAATGTKQQAKSESESEVTFDVLSKWLESAHLRRSIRKIKKACHITGVKNINDPFAGHVHDKRFGRSIEKIKTACRIARTANIKWLWIDTCCIDKSSDAEMAESLRSMYRWYRNAKICYAYLYDVDSTGTVGVFDLFQASKTLRNGEDQQSRSSNSVWFERGWTLQELLAPKEVCFYDFKWRVIGTKTELAKDIAAVTGIDAKYLGHDRAFRKACIATKMSWLANRTTTRSEDIAYSTLGIFSISDFTPLYGEGMSAFLRLQKALVPRQDESLYAWEMPDSKNRLCSGWATHEWGLPAPWPACFRGSAHINVDGEKSERYLGGFNILGPGVNVHVGRSELGGELINRKTARTLTLNCWTSDKKAVRIPIKRASKNSQLWRRQECHKLDTSGSSDVPKTDLNSIATGTMTVPVLVVQPSVADDSDDDRC